MKPTQLRVEDFADASPEMQAALSQLFRTLNPSLESLGAAAGGGLKLSGGAVSLAFQTGASVSASAAPFPLYVSKPFTGRVRHLIVSAVRNLTDASAVLSAAIQPDWEDMGDGRVKVRFLTGLAVSTKYELTLLALGD